ncbi:hypothetical protein [Flavobacterium sp.]|uniref:hypothetical protein n=1 Tax=Flavobacterium sp. TaxID=239 RepID=UPI00120E3D0F|nr:hypothetical protein [Flavobacterium sp.]RZJ71410.1 MAG: hypothetical protein EOO49_10135 [Flavobacterium sp.]
MRFPWLSFWFSGSEWLRRKKSSRTLTNRFLSNDSKFKAIDCSVTEYYPAENDAFGRILDTANKQQIELEMASHALKFNELVALETK